MWGVLCGCCVGVVLECGCECVGGCVGEWVSWCASVSFHSSINLCVRDDDTSHFRLNSALELNKKYRREYVSQITVCDNGHTHLTTHAATVYANKVQSMSSILRLTVTTSLGLVSTPVA